MYEPEDVLEMLVISELRRKGFSLQKIRGFERTLRKEMPRRLTKGPELYLVTDGKHVWFLGSAQTVVDLLRELKGGVALVSVSDLAMRLARQAERSAA